MPAFTIHDLYASMGGAASPQDYRNKERNTWTVYDWLNAVTAGVTGEGASPAERRKIDSIKRVIGNIAAYKAMLPGLTEQQMAADYGRRFRDLHRQIAELAALPAGALRDEDRELLSGIVQAMPEPDSEQVIAEAETAVAVARYKADAQAYIERQIRERYREEAKAGKGDFAVREKLASRCYVANFLSEHAAELIPNGYPRRFTPEYIETVSNQLLEDDIYKFRIDFELNHHPLPPLPQPGQEAQYRAQIRQNLNDLDQGVNQAAIAGGSLEHDLGGRALDPSRVQQRLAVLRDVKKALDATGTGYKVFYFNRRDENSTEYERVRREVDRQLKRLEAGLPLGPADDRAMLERLDDYTHDREKEPFYGYAKIRQNNVLKLYSEYTRFPAPHEPNEDPPYPSAAFVQQRFNQGRGVADNPDSADYVNLASRKYAFDVNDRPGDARTKYRETLAALERQQAQAAAGRALSDSQRLVMEQNIRRLYALHTQMVTDRAGLFAPYDEAALRRIMADQQNAPAVLAAVNAANRSSASFGELLGTFRATDHAAASRLYFDDPAHFEDPLRAEIQQISYPTVQQHLTAALTELHTMQMPGPGVPLSPEQADRLMDLSLRIIALKPLAAAPEGAGRHLSEGDLAKAIDDATGYSYARDAALNCRRDGQLANEYRASLNAASSLPDLLDRADRFALGHVGTMMDEAVRAVTDLPDGMQLDDAAATEEALVTIAAIANLRDNAEGYLPGRNFLSRNMFTHAELDAAKAAVRGNQAFMNAIGHPANSTDLKRTVNSMASLRYARLLAEADAQAATVRNPVSPEGLTRTREEYKERFARMMALRTLQRNANNSSLPVSDEQLQETVQRIKLTEEYLAVARAIDRTPHAIYGIIDGFRRQGSELDAYLQEQPAAVPYAEAPAGSIGSRYDMQFLNPGQYGAQLDTPEGRQHFGEFVLAVMTYRQMAAEAPQGYLTAFDPQEYLRVQNSIRTSQDYRSFVQRMTASEYIARDIYVSLTQYAPPIYLLKGAHDRAQADGLPYVDPIVVRMRELSAERAEEVNSRGINSLSSMLADYKRGTPLTENQRNDLMDAAVLMVAGKNFVDTYGRQHSVSAADLDAKIAELKAGETEESRSLRMAVERAALDGGSVGELMALLNVPSNERAQALADYAKLTPAEWAQKAQETLNYFNTVDHPAPWTEAEIGNVVNTYAQLHVMRMLEKDPAAANMKLSAAELQQRADQYLTDDVRAELRYGFGVPTNMFSRNMIRNQIENTEQRDTDSRMQRMSKLQTLMALHNLEKKYFPGAFVNRNELYREMQAVQRDVPFKVLTHEGNDLIPPVDIRNLRGKALHEAIENFVYNSPLRRTVVLGGESPDSALGRVRLMANAHHEPAQRRAFSAL